MSIDYSFPFIPYTSDGFTGMRLDYATVLPPAANVHYVRSSGAQDYDPPELSGRIKTTINEALAQCRSGRGDVVYLLQGHAENISAADMWSNLVAGTKIIGLGDADERPTFTWTASAGTVLINVANVTIKNCRFLAAGALDSTTALTVTVAFPVTASGFRFVGNEMNVGVDANQLCTDAFTLSAAADNCLFAQNRIWGEALAEITSIITTSAAGADRLNIIGNYISAFVVTAATGVLLDLDAGEILNNNIIGNHLANNTASSKFVIDPHATSTGVVDGNRYYVGDGGTGPASLGFATFTTTYKFGLNYCVTAVSASAILCPAADS
jgi:hypothetical protein